MLIHEAHERWLTRHVKSGRVHRMTDVNATEVARLIVSFLSGGVAGGVVSHFLAGRAERRTTLRAKDSERVETVRRHVAAYKDIVERECARVRMAKLDAKGDGTDNVIEYDIPRLPEEDEFEVDVAVAALADRQLSRMWSDLTSLGGILPFQLSRLTAPAPGELVGLRESVRMKRVYERLMDRLNELERKR